VTSNFAKASKCQVKRTLIGVAFRARAFAMGNISNQNNEFSRCLCTTGLLRGVRRSVGFRFPIVHNDLCADWVAVLSRTSTLGNFEFFDEDMFIL